MNANTGKRNIAAPRAAVLFSLGLQNNIGKPASNCRASLPAGVTGNFKKFSEVFRNLSCRPSARMNRRSEFQDITN